MIEACDYHIQHFIQKKTNGMEENIIDINVTNLQDNFLINPTRMYSLSNLWLVTWQIHDDILVIKELCNNGKDSWRKWSFCVNFLLNDYAKILLDIGFKQFQYNVSNWIEHYYWQTECLSTSVHVSFLPRLESEFVGKTETISLKFLHSPDISCFKSLWSWHLASQPFLMKLV